MFISIYAVIKQINNLGVQLNITVWLASNIEHGYPYLRGDASTKKNGCTILCKRLLIIVRRLTSNTTAYHIPLSMTPALPFAFAT